MVAYNINSMKNILTNIGILAMVGVSALTTGCRESFDYEEAYRANPEFVYRENFEKAFGKIDPNQSWDFTKGGKSVSLTRAGESEVIHITSTNESQYHDGDRVQNAALVKNGAIGIVSGRLAYENEHILAGSKPFALQTKGKFGICPIWRWACMSKYNLQIIGIPADGSIPKIYEIDYGVLMKAISSKQGDATEPSFVYNGGDASGSWQGFILDFEPGSFVVFKLVDKN